MRRVLIVANWKMHGSRAGVDALVNEIVRGITDFGSTEIVLCPPAVYLWRFEQLLAATPLHLGVQNIHEQAQGAFTGEISAPMVREFGCRYVIVGHSERRLLFGETDEVVARKSVAALRHGLTPIVCVGETLEERDDGQALAVVARQLDALLSQLDVDAVDRIVIAYEPVWAIGTGRSASADEAQQVHRTIRDQLLAWSPQGASIPILYGGSVKPDNSELLLSQPDIDGALVGGASLDASQFLAICNKAKRRWKQSF